jgi:hypothetical protein
MPKNKIKERSNIPPAKGETAVQEHYLTGRIAGLVTFELPDFGTRASFTIEDTGRASVVCAVEGNVARNFIAHYGEGDLVAVRGIHESRPSTAAANTPWVGRFRVRAVRVAEDVHLAA